MKALIILLLSIFSINLYAQNWADLGATWHYSYYSMIGDGYSEISYQGDTTLLGVEAKKLALNNHYFNFINGEFEDSFRGIELTYSDSDHIYHYINGEFKVLYDFSAQVGDTLTHYLYSDLLFEECDSLGRSIVIETGTELINGEELRWYELEHLDGIAMLPGKIIEKMGSHGYMFPYINGCVATEEASDPLRCYEDDNFELYQNPDYEGACEFTVSIEEEIKDDSKLTLYPNPSDHVVNIESTTLINALNISVYSIEGQLIKSIESRNSNEVSIDVTDLNSGMYFIEIIGDNAFRNVKPFVVK